jgi:hypothetical protein
LQLFRWKNSRPTVESKTRPIVENTLARRIAEFCLYLLLKGERAGHIGDSSCLPSFLDICQAESEFVP